MGGALVRGALDSRFLDARNVFVFDLDPERMKALKSEHSVASANSNAEAVKNSEFVFLCVKPQGMDALLTEIKEFVRRDHCLVSIAAGVQTKTIEKHFSLPVPVVRVMPNTPALARCGMSVLTKGRFAQDAHLDFVSQFFLAVGKVTVLTEEHFDAVTAVSGSGPAYFFYLTESLRRAAEELGLPHDVAELLSRQTLLGSARMLEGSDSPEDLCRKVTSPGGTTESALRYLSEKNWADVFAQAVRKAKERSQELSKSS
ncbi:MAG: pyrroline-5-carboxylate reductase [Elusimicrobia bacterium]|nr:pyrroline-5-carboxylate reductase [Elusimicrobiota bacterium]MBI3012316.1 pyrroline-5-carboxylate reductase [Elusimicrobiota bacterium]